MKIRTLYKNILIFTFLLLIITACSTNNGFLKVSLKEVEVPENIKNRFGQSKIINFVKEDTLNYSFENDMIKVNWIPLQKQILFSLKNKTKHSLKIIWDQAVFVDINGLSHRLIHSSINFNNRNNPQPPTVVVKNSRVNEAIIPVNNVRFVNSYWVKSNLIKVNRKSNSEKILDNYIGKTIKILLPLEIQDTINEYIFTFEIYDFTIPDNREKDDNRKI